uniref:NUCB1-like N-terminal domain-containing protein n=1 Tax=Lutzomyia longipalpis TaxID=7200 RepID=A0A1B0CJE8_LUTLO
MNTPYVTEAHVGFFWPQSKQLCKKRKEEKCHEKRPNPDQEKSAKGTHFVGGNCTETIEKGLNVSKTTSVDGRAAFSGAAETKFLIANYWQLNNVNYVGKSCNSIGNKLLGRPHSPALHNWLQFGGKRRENDPDVSVWLFLLADDKRQDCDDEDNSGDCFLCISHHLGGIHPPSHTQQEAHRGEEKDEQPAVEEAQKPHYVEEYDPNDPRASIENVLEYNNYLKEVVNALESDSEFREKLNKLDEVDIRTGKIAQELEYVNHNVRTKLDEIKRTELERLRKLAIKQFEMSNDIDREHLKIPEHLDHSNQHTFEVEDLKKLIHKASNDLAEADRLRREEFKRYEMQKEFEKQEKLRGDG